MHIHPFKILKTLHFGYGYLYANLNEPKKCDQVYISVPQFLYITIQQI